MRGRRVGLDWLIGRRIEWRAIRLALLSVGEHSPPLAASSFANVGTRRETDVRIGICARLRKPDQKLHWKHVVASVSLVRTWATELGPRYDANVRPARQCRRSEVSGVA